MMYSKVMFNSALLMLTSIECISCIMAYTYFHKGKLPILQRETIQLLHQPNWVFWYSVGKFKLQNYLQCLLSNLINICIIFMA